MGRERSLTAVEGMAAKAKRFMTRLPEQNPRRSQLPTATQTQHANSVKASDKKGDILRENRQVLTAKATRAPAHPGQERITDTIVRNRTSC